MASAAGRGEPSTAAIAIATAILAGLGGWFLGQASALGVFGARSGKDAQAQSQSRSRGKEGVQESDGEESADEEDEDEDGAQELRAFKDSGEECKLVLVVRTDLGMTKGKIAAQAGHATLACYKSLSASPAGRHILQRWERYGQAKVAVQVKSQDELELLQAQAVSLGVCARAIRDQGRTQIAAGSMTVLGVGPAPKSVVDVVTGELKLL